MREIDDPMKWSGQIYHKGVHNGVLDDMELNRLFLNTVEDSCLYNFH